MCDPVTLGMLALGTGAQVYAGNRTKAAQTRGVNRAMEAELGRQGQYSEREQAALGEILSQSGFDPLAGSEASQVAERTASGRESVGDQLTNQGRYHEGGSDPLARVVRSENERAATEVDRSITSAASLRGLSDALTRAEIGRAPLVRDMGAQQLFARRSGALLPGELDHVTQFAGARYQPLALAGDALTAFGTMRAMQPRPVAAPAAPGGFTAVSNPAIRQVAAATPPLVPRPLGTGLYSLVPQR